jgi:HEAT repeat protein
MLQAYHFELLEQLRFSKTAQQRKNVLQELIALEERGRLEPDDLLKLLDDPDPVFRVYAIGAFGRHRIRSGVDRLKKLYLDNHNPLMLSALLAAFTEYGTGDFVKAVLAKLKKSRRAIGARSSTGARLDRIFDNAFLLDQILVPSLKYLRVAGNPRIEKSIRMFLNHEDPVVRWHTLLAYDHLSLSIKEKRLRQIETSDPSALLREQAAIMLAKRSDISGSSHQP